jgi:hypothetical protein
LLFHHHLSSLVDNGEKFFDPDQVREVSTC